ncbi:MAG: twin-arginine translocase TatA/TatE family subunit [Kiritimatiellaeota bacterium]|nr:twin-arginine translocase TatA/TatE family subunit [Kiritimatiellota bacterium]
MGSIGWQEILLIVVVCLLLFGAKRIPEIARALGKASHEFKKAKDEIKKEGESLLDESEKTEK